MGVVMIREDAEPRIRALAAKMGWDERTAWGCLICLWRDSQSIGVWQASPEEILFWIREHDKSQGEKLIRVLQDRSVRFLDPLPEGLLEIRGNRGEIEKIEARRERGRRGARDRWSKWESDAPTNAPTNAPSIAPGIANGNGATNAYAVPKLNQAKPSQAKLDTPPPEVQDPLDLAIAVQWSEFARSVSKTVKPDPAKWANTVRLLRERDGLTHGELEAMLAFVRSDHFWQHNAASLDGLRTRSKNGLRKFENILAAQKAAKPAAKPAGHNAPMM